MTIDSRDVTWSWSDVKINKGSVLYDSDVNDAAPLFTELLRAIGFL